MVRVQEYYEFVLVTETPACPAYPAYPAYRQAGGRQESKNRDKQLSTVRVSLCSYFLS